MKIPKSLEEMIQKEIHKDYPIDHPSIRVFVKWLYYKMKEVNVWEKDKFSCIPKKKVKEILEI